MILKPMSRESWLEARKCGIGGSDAGAVLGVNKYKSNVELWREKVGEVNPADISDKPAVMFGKSAEPHIRELFKLEHPEFAVDYHEFYMYVNDKHPYIYATLDGELTAQDGRRGILEIKTATINNHVQWRDWREWDAEAKTALPKIPDSYYAQCLHQLAATGWDFVILFAYIRSSGENAVTLTERHIDRAEVQNDIDYLIGKESEFWQSVEKRTCPPLILPRI